MAACQAFGQAPKTLDRLETKNGRTYEKVTVTKIEADGISITHDSGTAKVSFEKMSAELREAFGYDPDKARQYQSKIASAAAETERREMASRSKSSVRTENSGKTAEDHELVRKVNSLAKKISVDGFQSSDVGIIGTIKVMKLVSEPVPGSMVQRKSKWLQDYKADGVLCGVKGAKVQTSIDMTGRPLGLSDTTSSSIVWEGKAWRIGSIRYKTSQGLLRTCPLYTGSETEAVNFYRTNGFSRETSGVVKRVD